jgi:hypothetical protein
MPVDARILGKKQRLKNLPKLKKGQPRMNIRIESKNIINLFELF